MNSPSSLNNKPWRRVWLVPVILVGAAAHLPAIFRAEITGEDELLFNSVTHAFLATVLGVPDVWRIIFRFYYPPMQWALPAPLVGLFGTAEWTMRLPGALAGIVAAVLLFFLLERKNGDRRAAIVAALLAAGGGVVANHHYALTCGIFAAGAAVCALGLARFMEAQDESVADRWLLFATVGIVFAMMTLQDGLFYLPIIAAAYFYKRRFRVTPVAWCAAVMIAGWVAAYGVFWILLPRFWGNQGVAGGMGKVEQIFSHIGAFRWRDLLQSFAAGSSWPMVVSALVFCPIGWKEASRGIRWAFILYLFPLALWTFVFDYPNVRSAHMLLAFPAFAGLWALGAVRAYDSIRVHTRMGSWGWALLCVLLMLSAFWQTAVLHIDDWIPDSKMGPSWLVLRDYFPQGRRVLTYGQPAAGWWIRTHTAVEEGVCSDLGGAFADYYARRPYHAIQNLAAYAPDPTAARAAGVRYYADTRRSGNTLSFLKQVPVALEVHHRGQTVLRLYDLWRETDQTDRLDASVGRHRFNQDR